MVKERNGTRYDGVQLILKNLIAGVCVLLLLSGCVKPLSPEELAAGREESVHVDLDTIKPPPEINFEKPLTLNQIIEIGLYNNLELRVADFESQVAKKETVAQNLKMLPGLHAGASYSYRDRLRKSDVYNWQTDTDLPDNTVGELKDSSKADLTMTFNVLDTAIAYVSGQGSKMHEQILEQRRLRQGHTLALDLTQAYWQAAAVEDALDHVHEVEAGIKKLSEQMNLAADAGRLDRIQAIDAELRLKELELTIRQLQANLSSSRLKLSRLMGLNQNVQFTLFRPPIKPILEKLPHPRELDIDRLEEYALLHRPELFESDIRVLIQKKEARSAFLSLFPGLNLFTGSHYEDNRLLKSKTWNTVGVGVGWDLLDIPSRLAALHGRKKAVDMVNAQRLMMTVGVITQVHIALLDYAIKLDRFRLLDQTYGLSDRLLNLARKKHEQKYLTDLAFTQRNLEQMAAKLRRDESVVDLLVAHKRLCLSMGVNPQECNGHPLQSVPVAASNVSIDEMPLKDTTGAKQWKCTVCDYVHTGPDAPEKCPVCGVDHTKFTAIPADEQAIPADLGYKNEEDDDSDWNEDMEEPVKPAKTRSMANGWAGSATDRFLWEIQLGAFTDQAAANRRIEEIKGMNMRLMDNRDTRITTVRKNGKLYNRVRIVGLAEQQAKDLDAELKNKGFECWILAPSGAR